MLRKRLEKRTVHLRHVRHVPVLMSYNKLKRRES
jgi:hypothetical protein